MTASELERMTEILVRAENYLKKSETDADVSDLVRRGSFAFRRMGDLERMGTAQYCLSRQADFLRSRFREIGNLQISLFERYDAGEPIDFSFVTMLTHQELKLVLVAGAFDVAEKFATLMGGRDKIEKQNDLPFIRTFGYSMKYLVLDDKDKFLEPFTQLLERCQKTGAKGYMAYAKAMLAIMNRDEGFLKESFIEIKKGYKRVLAKEHPGWSYWPNYLGIGLANLAIHRGMKVEVEDEFIPRDLLIEAKNDN